MHRIDEGPAYTKGKSFRAIAEARARKYRAHNLELGGYDRYGHVLTRDDADRGWNFLPSLKDEILGEVRERADKGKGVDFNRTSRNMLSSQAMCFNLFVPFKRDRLLASELLRHFVPGLDSVDDVRLEYTPDDLIFGDQSGIGGVDCDVLVRYTTEKGAKGLVVIETKYAETGFSGCGFRKPRQKDPCPISTVVDDDHSNCRYCYKKKYSYWKVGEKSGLYQRDKLHSGPCPFGGSLWQLWTNLSLAYALATQRQSGYSEFSYAVMCPQGNTKLTGSTEVFREFESLLHRPEVFKVIYLEHLGQVLKDNIPAPRCEPWVHEFVERYCWQLSEDRSDPQR